MIPVDQIRTGNPKGQCTEAAVASLLEVPLDEVPDQWGGQSADEPRPTRPWCQLCALVLYRGYQYTRFYFDAQPLDGLVVELPPRYRDLLLGYHLLGGENPDGVGHMCVGRGLELVHDPNPSRRGLVTVDEIVLFVPLDEVDDDHAHWICQEFTLTDGEWVQT